MKSRTRARSIALQVLYEVDIANHIPGDVSPAERRRELPGYLRSAIFALLMARL